MVSSRYFLEDAFAFICSFAGLCILHTVIIIVIKLVILSTSCARRAATGILISPYMNFDFQISQYCLRRYV